jgi:hypothetical protein
LQSVHPGALAATSQQLPPAQLPLAHSLSDVHWAPSETLGLHRPANMKYAASQAWQVPQSHSPSVQPGVHSQASMHEAPRFKKPSPQVWQLPETVHATQPSLWPSALQQRPPAQTPDLHSVSAAQTPPSLVFGIVHPTSEADWHSLAVAGVVGDEQASPVRVP